MHRRIRRPDYLQNAYMELTDKEYLGLFETFKDVFMAGVMIGFLHGERREFSKSLEGISPMVFNASTDHALLNLIYLLETRDLDKAYSEDPECLDEKLVIAEEYAASGVKILFDRVTANRIKAKEILFELVGEFEHTIPDEKEADDINIVGKFL